VSEVDQDRAQARGTRQRRSLETWVADQRPPRPLWWVRVLPTEAFDLTGKLSSLRQRAAAAHLYHHFQHGLDHCDPEFGCQTGLGVCRTSS
jgi:hypothetical protein